MLLLRPSCYPGAPPAAVISCTKVARLSVERWAKGKEKRSAIVDILPIELMERVLEWLFMTWRLATRTMRVSKTFATHATSARALLPPGEWWTGEGPPLLINSALPPVEYLHLQGAGYFNNLNVAGSDVYDVTKVLLGVRRMRAPSPSSAA